MSNFDVVISGAGVAGALTALALAAAGLRVAVIERRPPQASALASAPADPNARVVALAPSSVRVLQRLGQWPLAAGSACPYQQMQVCAEDQTLTFDAAMIGDAALGWIVDLAGLQHQLSMALAQQVTVCSPAEIVDVQNQPAQARVLLDDGRWLGTRLLVAAEGGRSDLRERAGIALIERDYHCQALVARLETEQRNPGIAFQRFAAGGPLALLPLADGASSLVWTRPQAHAAALMAAPDAAFIEAVEQAGGERFGKLLSVHCRAGFGLRMALAERSVAERLVLIGDSAHVVHPLAGLGLNLGIWDGAALAEVLTAAQHRGRDLGAATTLARYAAWRDGDNRIAAHWIDRIERSFSGQSGPWSSIARQGLGLVDQSSVLKQFFALQATGWGGRVPALARRG